MSCAIGRPAENWYGHEESNPDLYVRSVPSCPLDDARVKLWLAAQSSNLEPPRSERGAPPIAPAASGRGWANRTPEASFKDWRLSTNRTPFKWGDRRELNSRSWSHNPTPKPLGYGHIWCLRERSNLRIRLFGPALVHLSYTAESGGDGENRTLIGWVQTSSPPVERPPHWLRRWESNPT